MLERTPSQTVGPFFEVALCVRVQNEIVAADASDALRIEGRILDGSGEPVPDAMVEIWPEWGRCGTDGEGRYSFVTRRPPPAGAQAPHLAMLVFARGLLKPVLTRLYFPDEPANAHDPVLLGISDDERATLVAHAEEECALRFDVHLQGERQTAFFALETR
jgi:protocatechuate 3,4-dioxygenase, alpha subunit